ncbi:hypothetical protein BDV19DRAFT_398766 [Aspergillus venezuelensis]
MPSSLESESTVPKQRATTIILPALAILFLTLRLVSRKIKRVALGLDDWTLILVLIFVLACAGLNYASTYYGMGQHLAFVLQEGLDVAMFFKVLYVFEPIYITAVAIIKFSVLLMYNRIFPVRPIRIGSYILGSITLAWLISIDLVAIFQCTPVRKAWYQELPGTCIDLKAALIGSGVPNFITDILILALPGRSIWMLQTGVWQRVSIIAVFLSGSFVVFATIYRFSLIFALDMHDIPWTLADAQTWCVVETSAGIISACLPTLVPLIRLVARGSDTRESDTHSHSHPRSKPRAWNNKAVNLSRSGFEDRPPRAGLRSPSEDVLLKDIDQGRPEIVSVSVSPSRGPR